MPKKGDFEIDISIFLIYYPIYWLLYSTCLNLVPEYIKQVGIERHVGTVNEKREKERN